MSEETPKEETQVPVEEKREKNCVVISEHMKPLFDCCKDFEEGKIDPSDFFARTLISTGKFMEEVKKTREMEKSE